MRKSLFAHLAVRFSAHPENLATEALAYVLDQSPEASKALVHFVHDLGCPVPNVTRWNTQVAADDDALPDLVGEDEKGHTPVIIENKFWAGLTINQPGTYLRRLPQGSPGCVLVVAPAVRIEFLWSELLHRAADVEAVHDIRDTGPELRSARVGVDRTLALVSWRVLLGRIGAALNAAGDLASGSDLMQLASLSDEMDTDAFLPLRSEELTGALGSRLVQLRTLVEDCWNRLLQLGVGSNRDQAGTSLGISAGNLYWGYYLNLSSVTCMLRLAPISWAKHRATPIWLQVGYKGSPSVAALRKALDSLDTEPGRVVLQPNFVDVAIDLPIGMEKDAVMEAIIDQVTRVKELLAGAAPTTTSHTPIGPE